MASHLLSLLLALQMTFPLPAAASSRMTCSPVQEPPRVQKLWWGMLDPELSAWAARIPMEESDGSQPVQWCWSWRGFLAALLGQPMMKEATTNAPSV